MLSTRDLRFKDTNRLEVKGWKKIFHSYSKQKRAELGILISDVTHFKSKKVSRDKDGHHILIKISIQQEDIIITNIYVSNDRPSKYVKNKRTELKGKTDHSTGVGEGSMPYTEQQEEQPERRQMRKYRT